MSLFKRDVFGNIIFFKRLLMSVLGSLTYHRLNVLNKTRVTGMEHINNLPGQNVLFVSNHQTYFADVMTMYHIFFSSKWGFKNSIDNPVYLLNPKASIYFVAAEETMTRGFLPRIFALAGAVTVKRTWRSLGKEVKREVDLADVEKIGLALSQGWVVSFPQGTTSAWAKGRKGTAYLIKQFKPIVVPITINGFRRAFDKKGLMVKKAGTTLEVKFKAPLTIDFESEPEVILHQVMDAIEQAEDYAFKKD